MKKMCYTQANRSRIWRVSPTKRYRHPHTSSKLLTLSYGVAHMLTYSIFYMWLWFREHENGKNHRRTFRIRNQKSPIHCLETKPGKQLGDYSLALIDKKEGRLTSPFKTLQRSATTPSYIVYYSLETAGSAPCHAQVANPPRDGLFGLNFHRQPLIHFGTITPVEIMVAFGVTAKTPWRRSTQGALPSAASLHCKGSAGINVNIHPIPPQGGFRQLTKTKINHE